MMDVKQNLKRFFIIALFIGLLAAAYYFVSSIVSPRPKVFVQLFDTRSRIFKHTSLKEINDTIYQQGKAALKIKVISKMEVYENIYGKKTYRDLANVRLFNAKNQEIGNIDIKLLPVSKEYVEGTGIVEIRRKADMDNTLQHYVSIMLSNHSRTADKLPVRVNFSE